MILSDKWGQGALFSYSNALGEKSDKGFYARLCGDRFGFLCETKNRCTLSVGADGICDAYFDTVMTDYVDARVMIGDGKFSVKVLFASPHTILICSDYAISVKAEFEKDISTKKSKKGLCFSSDGEEFALSSKKENGCIVYAFSYGIDANDLCEKALAVSFEEHLVKRLSFYSRVPDPQFSDNRIEKLYYKCVSVLLASTQSAQGLIKSDYIAPSKAEMSSLYSYWSAICTLGLRHICPQIAKDTLETILSSQSGDGLLPAVVSEKAKSSDLNPPVLAWCFWELYSVNNDAEMLKNAYASLKKYLHYIIETRDINKNHLFEWQPDEAMPLYSFESTMDNSPRFNDGIVLDSVDFTSYVANEAHYMSLIAEEISKHGEALYWGVVFERIKNAVNELLFDEDDKIYYDRSVVSNMFKKVQTSASFLPMFAGVCENRNAMALLKYLNLPDKFNLKCGVPSLSADNGDYCFNWWKGPTFIHHNYFIAKGLDKYEMHDKANEIKAKSLGSVLTEYENCGVLYEYYCAEGTKSAASLGKKEFSTSQFMFGSQNVNIRDFAPTAAIVVDMLLSKSAKKL